MKKLFLSICGLSVFLLNGCFLLRDSQLKERALAAAKNRIHTDLTREAKNQLGGEQARGNDFVAFVENDARFEVIQIQALGDRSAQAQVRVIMVSSSVRQHILKIVSKQRTEGESNSFNFEDSIPLILKERPGLTRDEEKLMNLDLATKD